MEWFLLAIAVSVILAAFVRERERPEKRGTAWEAFERARRRKGR